MNRQSNKINGFIVSLLIMLLAFGTANAQKLTPHYSTSIAPNSNGYYDFLPQGYSSTGTTLYPLMIFIHGMGEYGDGSSTYLWKVAKHGPIHVIKYDTWPTSFSVNGKSYKFVIVAPQWKSQATVSNVNALIDYAVKHYKVDPKRVYLTGLSAGGGVVESVSADGTVGKRIAATVEFCGTSTPSVTRATNIINNGVAFWGIHNKYDDVVSVSKTIDWVSDILSVKSTAHAKKTIPSASGHNCWTSRYVTTWTDGGLNIYQWMLQYARGTVSTTTNSVPVASAGSDKTITLPTNKITLYGSGKDADGSISKYYWSKVSGPSSYAFSSTTSATTTISNLVGGTYVFRLKVTDNAGATDYDDVNVYVNSSTTSTTITYTKREAENYTGMTGVVKQATTDVGGGYNLGYIDLHDWVYYNVSLSTSGTYKFIFRLASASTGAKFEIYDTYNSVKTLIGTVTVPNTGGWQTWKDVPISLSLKSGSHAITLYSVASYRWNINYFKYGTSTSTTTSNLLDANAANTTVSEDGTASALSVSPSSFTDRFVLTVNNQNTGTMKVQLINLNGVVSKEFLINKSAVGTTQTYLSAGTLTKGTYYLKVTMGEWTQSTKVTKL